MTKESAKLLASYLFSFSLLTLAASLAYFTFEMAAVSKQIPDILVSIEATSEKIEPVIGHVGEVVVLVPRILNEVEETRKMIPPILKEIEETRKIIPPILKEIEAIRKQIPVVLTEVKAVRKELPPMLASADRASAAVVTIAKEVEATRPLIPEVLKEIKTTRESIPPMMKEADVLIDKARVAGKEASRGAVSGFFSGVIMAPFDLIKNAGESISGMSEDDAKLFTEKDFELIKQVAFELLDDGSIGDVKKWENPDSGNSGSAELTDIVVDEYSDNECRTLLSIIFEDDKELQRSEKTLCKNDDDQWDIDE